MNITIEIYGAGANICEHPFARKDPSWAHHTHAVIGGEVACGISGRYLCWDTSVEDQSVAPTCPRCAKAAHKALNPAPATIAKINRIARHYGLQIARGTGYYYWLDLGGAAVEAESVMVSAVGHLSMERWMEEVEGAAKKRNG